MSSIVDTIIGVAVILSPVVYLIVKESYRRQTATTVKVSNLLTLPHVVSAIEHNKRVGLGILSTRGEYEHQVAGHTREVLLIDRDRIFKPMIKEHLFQNELKVYELSRQRGEHLGLSLASFIPQYFGCVCVNPDSNGDGDAPRLYLELSNLTCEYKRPCACDIKMGMQTYEPNADPKKIQRENAKYAYQKVVGFRITGFKVYNRRQQRYNFVDKAFGRSLAPDMVKAGLAFFFFDGYNMRRDIIVDVIHQLERLQGWIKTQTQYQFYCSSILIAYDSFVNDDEEVEKRCEKETASPAKMTCLKEFLGHCRGSSPSQVMLNKHEPVHSTANYLSHAAEKVQVKLIDFAHVHATDRMGIDTGYLFGLTALLTRLYEIIIDIDNQCDPFLPFTKIGYRTPRC